MTLKQQRPGDHTLQKLADKGAVDGTSLARSNGERPSANTPSRRPFLPGTHAMWLYYWLAANGINPMTDAKMITVRRRKWWPNMRVGNMDGYCVGEPWGHRAIADGIASLRSPPRHLEGSSGKGARHDREFVQKNPNTARAMAAAIIDAGRWIDAVAVEPPEDGRDRGRQGYSTRSVEVINQRILGRYQNGSARLDDPNHMKFYNDGAVTFPYLSDACGFSPSYRRWGLLKTDSNYLAVAKQVIRSSL